MGALALALMERFEHIRVSVHQGVAVGFGHDWSGPVPRSGPITQLLTSTMALGGYSRDDGSPALATARQKLLRGAYLATLLAAIDLECHTIVLTLIGGGAFANPHRAIWDAIHWALGEVDRLVDAEVHVVVNTRQRVAEEDRAEVSGRGGVFVELGEH
jgi:hypothetical protein